MQNITKFLIEATNEQGKPNALSDSLKDKFEKLFPSIPMMIATLIALTLVIIILWFLLYKPLKKSIKERQDYIQSNINDAENNNNLSKTKLEEANQRLAKAYEDANNIVKEAKIHGESVIASYTEKAKIESKRIKEKARLEIKAEHDALLAESKDNIVKAAIEISRKIIKKDVSEDSQNEIIDNFLNS